MTTSEPAAARSEEEPDTFLSALAFLSSAAAVIGLSLVVALTTARSGLGTPPSLLIVCAGIFLSAAYAPFLIPTCYHARLDRARLAYPLMMLAVMSSPVLFLWLPARWGYIYALTGLAGMIRAVPYLARSGWRTFLTVVVACGVMGVHLLMAQGLFASTFLPEMMVLGRFSGDPYFHAAIASMIRYNGVPSTGVDGTVPYHYHVGSHYWFAAIGEITDSDSAYAYLVGRTVFMLPSLCLAVLVAALCLRRSRPYDAPFLVIATTVILILIDGAKLDRYTYRSESEVFGIIVLLLAMPLLGDATVRARQVGTGRWPRLAPWPFLVLLAGFVKMSVGSLLGVVVGYALARTSPRSPLTIGVIAGVALSMVLLLRFGGGTIERMPLRPFGFLFYGNGLLAAISLVFAYGLAAAVVLAGLRRRPKPEGAGPRRYPWRGEPVALSWEELVLVVSAAAAVPVLLVSTFEVWYFVDAVLWFSLTVVLAGLSRADVTQLWRSIGSVNSAYVVIGFVIAMSAPPVLRAFPFGELAQATRELRSGVEREETRSARSGGGVRQFFADSLVRHRVLFGPEFGEALRKSYGVRAIELVRRVTDREGRSGLGVFVPPQNTRFWRYSVDCRSQPMFLPALAGLPMVRGLPPVAEGCPIPWTYGYADYGASSQAVDATPEELCRHAHGQGLRRVLMLRDVDVPDANTVLRCPGAEIARRHSQAA